MKMISTSLKSTFAGISDRQLLRQTIERHAPSINIDWNCRAKDLPRALAAACSELQAQHPNEHIRLIAALQQHNDVCKDSKAAERLTDCLKSNGLFDRFRDEVPLSRCELQNAAAWTMLHAPEIWNHLLISAQSLRIDGKGWEEYHVAAHTAYNLTHLDKLRADISSYLKKQTLHGEYVHVEQDEFEGRFSVIVSASAFPINTRQFDNRGNYAVDRDPNALNFMFDYHPATGVLNLKCALVAAKRRELASLFASQMLNTDLLSTTKPTYDLSRFLNGEAPISTHSIRGAISSARLEAIGISYHDADGYIRNVIMTTANPASNLVNDIQLHLAALHVPLSSATVDKVSYALTISRPGERKREISAAIRPDGFMFVHHDAALDSIITKFLKEVVA